METDPPVTAPSSSCESRAQTKWVLQRTRRPQPRAGGDPHPSARLGADLSQSPASRPPRADATGPTDHPSHNEDRMPLAPRVQQGPARGRPGGHAHTTASHRAPGPPILMPTDGGTGSSRLIQRGPHADGPCTGSASTAGAPVRPCGLGRRRGLGSSGVRPLLQGRESQDHQAHLSTGRHTWLQTARPTR